MSTPRSALAQRCSAVPPPAPLFSALLNYRHSAAARPSLTAEALQAWEGIEYLGGEERTNYPFVLSVDDLGEGFALTAQVQSPIDPQRICAYMHTALEQLVGALESAPATPVRSLDVLPAAERQQLLLEWNDTAADYPAEVMLHELFEAQVERTPDRVALKFEGRELTYRELRPRADRIAQALRARGVGRRQRIGLCVERGPEHARRHARHPQSRCRLRAARSRVPEERLRFMAEDAQLALLVSTTALAGAFGLPRERQLLLDADARSIASHPDTACQPMPGHAARGSGLCHLHLRLHRQAQGCGRAAPCGGQFPHQHGA